MSGINSRGGGNTRGGGNGRGAGGRGAGASGAAGAGGTGVARGGGTANENIIRPTVRNSSRTGNNARALTPLAAANTPGDLTR